MWTEAEEIFRDSACSGFAFAHAAWRNDAFGLVWFGVSFQMDPAIREYVREGDDQRQRLGDTVPRAKLTDEF